MVGKIILGIWLMAMCFLYVAALPDCKKDETMVRGLLWLECVKK